MIGYVWGQSKQGRPRRRRRDSIAFLQQQVPQKSNPSDIQLTTPSYGSVEKPRRKQFPGIVRIIA